MDSMIDFLIPARDARATLGQTLASLRAQADSAWRCLVVDDGSTDGTAQVAAAVRDPRITVLKRGPEGVAAARNAAFAATSAHLVCFLDADDVVDPRFTDRMSRAIGDADAVACAYTYAGPGLEPSGWTVTPGPDDHRPERLAELNPFSIGALVFRRAALARAASPGPLFPTDSRHEDWELLLRLARAGLRWAPVIAEPLFTYRLRPDSRTTGLRAMWIDGLKLIDCYHPAPRAAGPAQRRWTLRSLARAIIRDEHALAGEMLAGLGGLGPADEGVFAGALRWSLRREVVAGALADPGPAGLAALLASVVAPERAGDLAARVADPARYWARVARGAAASLEPGRTLVLFGMGRNGRELAAQLKAVGITHSVVDELSPDPGCGPRLNVADLGPAHAVVVTPDDRAGLMDRLNRTSAQIWLPEQLARLAAEGCAA